MISEKSGRSLNDLYLLNKNIIYESSLDNIVNYIKKINSKTVGIFSRTKAMTNGRFKKHFCYYFDYELQIIYDLTVLLTSECHNKSTINLHIDSFEKDLDSNDLCVCISHSTKEDLVNYLKFREERILVSYLGCDHNLIKDQLYKNILDSYKTEKFILILGTVEPRKNVRIVLDFIRKNQNLLNNYKFVFLGKDGWGTTFNQMLEKFNFNDKLINDRIKHFGFVSEEEKNILLMCAEFVIYPSFYEGFGLPVLEAFSVGCPVLASFSSSIPEVGEDVAYYFNPFSIESFEKGFYQLINDLKKRRYYIKKKCIEQAKKFSWEQFNNNIIQRIIYDLQKNNK